MKCTGGAEITATVINGADGVEIIEAVERKDLTFCLGLQFHPEVAVRKVVDKEADAGHYMDLESASSFFKAIDKAAKPGQRITE